MNMNDELILKKSPNIEFATNTFINVPVILRYEDINLITVEKNIKLEYDVKIPIYHSDGTKLATATNSRIFKNEKVKENIIIDKYPDVWVCKMNGREIFEIRQGKGDLFEIMAELYTQDGYFIKYSNFKHNIPVSMSNFIDLVSRVAHGCTILDVEIGFWVKRNGGVDIGIPRESFIESLKQESAITQR
jgi:hypothetical protein